MSNNPKKVAIVGAGIVGISTAIWLQRAGVDVVVIDREGQAGEATSYGNGGVLAACAMVPVTVPGLFAKAPRMLLDRNEPLFLKWRYLPRLAPWLIRYLRHANARDAARAAAALAPLVTGSLADHQALADGTGAECWLQASDYLYLYKDRAAFEADAFGWNLRRAHGIEWQELEGDAFRQFDPAFSSEIGFAVKMGQHGYITDPGRYVKALAAHMQVQGGQLLKGTVSDILRDGGRVSGLRIDGQNLHADAVVITAGIWSRELAARLGLKVPMETERGYHLELINPAFTPRTPVMHAAGKFVITPMQGRLRLAGIVEFGGLDAPPSKAPFDLLRRNIQKAMPRLTWQDESTWMGHRPAPADSIPVIGAVPGINGAWLGFGHHHIGLTAGPATGRLLAQMIVGAKTNLDASAYSPARFANKS